MTPSSPTMLASVRWLDALAGDPAAVDLLPLVGGKAASLVRLLRAGLPVPPGFVILPEAFRAPHDGNGTLAGLRPEAAAMVREAYQALSRRMERPDPPVAVRSSATAEDLQGASFAGQYDTYLGVRGEDAVVEYAGRCAASLHSTHADAYRRQREAAGQDLPPAAMAVVVQALVPAASAGVAFTADPVSGDGSQVIVNASWGLGASIVDGEVEGDTWRVARDTLAITQETIGSKSTRAGDTPGAPRVPVPEAAQRQASLQPQQVADVARLALRAAEVLACPADVEWALAAGQSPARVPSPAIGPGFPVPPSVRGTGRGWDGAGQLYLLQARPITALQAAATPAPPAAEAPRESSPGFPFVWPSPELSAQHWRLDGGPAAAPSTPWEEEERTASARSGRHAADTLGGERFRSALYLNGYRYNTDQPLPGTAAERDRRRLSFERVVDAFHDGGITYWEAVLFPEIEEGDRTLSEVQPETLPDAALADHLAQALAWYERLWTLHSFTLRTIRGQGSTIRRRLVELCTRLTGQDGEEQVAPLLAFVPNKLSEAIDGLMALAQTVQRHPALGWLFAAHTPAEILASLERAEDGAAFRVQLQQLLAEQALRSDAGAFTVRRGSQPGWRERPELVIELVQRYVPQDVDALRRTHEAGVADRDARVAALREGIPDPADRERFDLLLAAARREARAYEDHNYFIDCAAGALLSRALAAAGRRLAAAGALAAAEDVRWLYHREIDSALRTLDVGSDGGGETGGGSSSSSGDGGDSDSGPRWPALVQARQALHDWQRSLRPPDWLGAPPPPGGVAPGPGMGMGGMGPGAGAPAAPQAPAPPDVLVAGQPGSRGVATGRVRLVPRDAMVPEVEPGDVLVARNAGVLWTPVFPVAAAVVLDEGVLFQHAMLTCREYGVPGIFQAKRATSVLRDGQRVTVDGTHGWVLPADNA